MAGSPTVADSGVMLMPDLGRGAGGRGAGTRVTNASKKIMCFKSLQQEDICSKVVNTRRKVQKASLQEKRSAYEQGRELAFRAQTVRLCFYFYVF